MTSVVADTDERSEAKGHYKYKATRVVEQRVSNLAQGLLTLGTMTGPLLVVLNFIPQGVLAGLFFIMGVQALEANGITAKLLFLARDQQLTPKSHPLNQIERRAAVWLFVGIELVGFGATFVMYVFVLQSSPFPFSPLFSLSFLYSFLSNPLPIIYLSPLPLPISCLYTKEGTLTPPQNPNRRRRRLPHLHPRPHPRPRPCPSKVAHPPGTRHSRRPHRFPFYHGKRRWHLRRWECRFGCDRVW